MIGIKAWALRYYCYANVKSSFTDVVAPRKTPCLLVEGKLLPLESLMPFPMSFSFTRYIFSCYGKNCYEVLTLPMKSLHKHHEHHARVLWCRNPNPRLIRRLTHYVTCAATKWDSMGSRWQCLCTTKATHELPQCPFINLGVERMAYTPPQVTLDPLPNGV